jgi:nuclear transport factor 2 (NTF2) superfamily protein
MTPPEPGPVTPLVVNIHAEPDGVFHLEADGALWHGFEMATRLMPELRSRIEERTGRPAHFSWQFRADGQIARTYGKPGWAFVRYAKEIEALMRAGDDIGLHQHGYRWDASNGVWIEDYGNQPWMEEVASLGFAAYRGVFGRPPESFTAGVSWTNSAMVRLVESLGARYELTAGPGRDKPFPSPIGQFTGRPPDTRRMPRHPYRPSAADFQVPDLDREDGLWVIPLTTGRQSSGGKLRRTFRRLTGTMARHEFITKLFLQSPTEYLGPVFHAAPDPIEQTHFTLDIRSDAFCKAKNCAAVRRNIDYLTSPERPWQLLFTTPQELVAHYLAETRPERDPRSPTDCESLGSTAFTILGP